MVRKIQITFLSLLFLVSCVGLVTQGNTLCPGKIENRTGYKLYVSITDVQTKSVVWQGSVEPLGRTEVKIVSGTYRWVIMAMQGPRIIAVDGGTLRLWKAMPGWVLRYADVGGEEGDA